MLVHEISGALVPTMARKQREFAAMVLAALLGIVFLNAFYSRLAQVVLRQEQPPTELIRMEKAVIWVPDRFIQFAKSQSDRCSEHELIRRFKAAGLEGRWFAYAERFQRGSREPEYRCVIVNAEPVTTGAQTLDVLRMVAQAPVSKSSDARVGFGLQVVAIPEAWLEENPRTVVESLFERFLKSELRSTRAPSRP